jgi:tetratricopeptide (TPR) repeat protein
MMRILAAALAGVLALGGVAPADTPPAEGPHEMGLPTTVADWAHGARLYDGLGTFHRTITTSVPQAQQYFDQGMRFLYAFNHDEATRSFAEAARLDPGCAICFWGVALTVGPNYNLPAVVEPRTQVAWQALQQAQAQAAHASPVEQALIGALGARYPSAKPPTAEASGAVVEAYAQAMRAVAARFPDDLDVQVLCAEAGMSVHAWKLWDAQGTPAAGTLEIQSRLESVLKRDPSHPGANHYYVHVVEASPDPAKGVAAAERLRGMMPAAGHLEHMPAHIMQRVGRYEDAAEANRLGAAADKAYFASTAAPDYYAMYLAHNYSFLAFSTAMEGRKAETLAAVQEVNDAIPLPMLLAMGDSGWNLSQQYAALVRFGLWDEMIAIQAPAQNAPGLTAAYLFSRGVSLAARGQLDEARKSLAALDALAAAAPADAVGGFNTLKDLVAVASPVLGARIAASEGHDAEAVKLLEQAVAAEDRLAYNEPSDWFFPVRHLLGAELLIAGRPREAEQVYRADLKRNPDNGWALYGLQTALARQGRTAEAARVRHQQQLAWKHADVVLPASAFWYAGVDTASCECQHLASADGQASRSLLRPEHEAGVD